MGGKCCSKDGEGGCCSQPSTGPLLIAAFVLALGIASCGYFISSGLPKINVTNRVDVKGLAEREVKADMALWPLKLVATGDDLATLQTKLENDRKIVIDFLISQGLKEDEVTRGRMEVTDLLASNYRSEDALKNRFLVYANIMVRSDRAELVQTVSNSIGNVIRSGVVFSQDSSASLSPYFIFTKLNEIKPSMLAEATRNARAAAEQFARDSGEPLGRMIRADQGVFSILPAEDIGEMEYKQLTKKVRVVSTVVYALAH